MLTPQWADLFDTYHGCHAPSAVHVFHRNGCGPTPRACHRSRDLNTVREMIRIELSMSQSVGFKYSYCIRWKMRHITCL